VDAFIQLALALGSSKSAGARLLLPVHLRGSPRALMLPAGMQSTSGKMGDLWLIRHGETEWSRSGRHTGRSDLPLTAEGERQAERLRRRLAGHAFAQVLTSPLRRARETCRLAGLGDVAVLDDDLHEWDYGAFEGRTSADIEAEVPGWSLWTHGVRGGESVEQVGVRAERSLARARAVGGDVALVSHGHLLRVLTARWLGLPAVDGRLFVLDPASLSVLGHEHEAAVIRLWNEASAGTDSETQP
jgi:broad specificity phosphatase PhoE